VRLAVTLEGPGKVGIQEDEDSPLRPGEVRLRSLYSGIPAGTELTAYRGSNPYLSKRWDEGRHLFLEGEVSLQHPIEGWGYEEVGEVAYIAVFGQGRPGLISGQLARLNGGP
jgi:threonine dehydrogenase-like Zn-dependent dehydrogenase